MSNEHPAADALRWAGFGPEDNAAPPAPAPKPIAQLVIFMDRHDMGQSLAPNPPFKSHRIMVTDWEAAEALPLGTYQLVIVPAAGVELPDGCQR